MVKTIVATKNPIAGRIPKAKIPTVVHIAVVLVQKNVLVCFDVDPGIATAVADMTVASQLSCAVILSSGLEVYTY